MDSPSPILASMDANEAAEELGRLYPEVFHRLYRRRDPRAWCPSPETLALLRHLAGTGPLTVMEAARHFDRSQAAISERFERLMKRGLLERMQDERDRRQHLVWLTEQGLACVAEESRVLSDELLAGATSRMSAEDRETLIHGLHALIAASEAAARERKSDDE